MPIENIIDQTYLKGKMILFSCEKGGQYSKSHESAKPLNGGLIKLVLLVKMFIHHFHIGYNIYRDERYFRNVNAA